MITAARPELDPDGVFDRRTGHEQVVFCQDKGSGLRAIIAIYSTALGPALGGTRFYPYQDEQAALTDVLRLSRAMAYKSAAAGLDLGGGKAVIIGDPARVKSESLLRAYGRFVESLAGRYLTACDIGTTERDMDVVARESRYVTGRSRAGGGAGDSSELTSFGVTQAMLAAAEHVWGVADLEGRRVGVEGVGKVGRRLVGHLVEAGASVVVCDPDRAAVAALLTKYPHVDVVSDEHALRRAEIDIYAPCALGGCVDETTASVLSAEIVCGGANNQLAAERVQKRLSDRRILYVPDYVANAGGLIQVADEIDGFQFARAKARAAGIFDTTRSILAEALARGDTPVVAADRLAERRMSEIGALRSIHLNS
ncbi:Glu/Leu/Phe/Val family dehydrogenase [Actinacidiphila oryziradicis]|uniref:Valine dehydrogenase n=1 Tax=Actinacidiphila oryziradicis TaxID=2571141 RepID=A0A4V5N0A9_9ACTN|nr:Glu/Leu/Phe/Val dehydrogenase dimerization domain-containing protein [Actinacidiphila oryziradicis]TKA11329.1 Glu/Leu/Phe/Val dehydrogenase [Actinacidiphila oryziradicis]